MSAERAWATVLFLVVVALALLPLARPRENVLNFVFLVLLAITLAQSWNVVAGYAGQVNLGHAAFFGTGALVARVTWLGGWPLPLAFIAAAAAGVAIALIIGLPTFRLRGVYFSVGTLALAEVLRITVTNTQPNISALPTSQLIAASQTSTTAVLNARLPIGLRLLLFSA